MVAGGQGQGHLVYSYGPTADRVRISVGAGASGNIPVSCRNHIVHPLAIYHRTGK